LAENKKHEQNIPKSPQLNANLDQWKQFYNYIRTHGAHDGKTPYEALKSFLEKA